MMNNGSKRGAVRFIGLDDPSDVSKLQSRAVDGFALDEPAPALGTGESRKRFLTERFPERVNVA